MMSRGTRERHHRAPAAALATGRMARLRRLLALLAVAATPVMATTMAFSRAGNLPAMPDEHLRDFVAVLSGYETCESLEATHSLRSALASRLTAEQAMLWRNPKKGLWRSVQAGAPCTQTARWWVGDASARWIAHPMWAHCCNKAPSTSRCPGTLIEAPTSCDEQKEKALMGRCESDATLLCDSYLPASVTTSATGRSTRLVYSFGIANQWTFEDWAGSRGFEVHAFDPTIRTRAVHEAHAAKNVHFHYMGLGALNGTAGSMTFGNGKEGYGALGGEVLPLDSLIERLGHQAQPIQLLKIDCEGCEWEAFVDVATRAPAALEKVCTIILEVHVTRTLQMNSTADLRRMATFWERYILEQGFRFWYLHANPGAKFDRQVHPKLIDLGLDPSTCCYEIGLHREVPECSAESIVSHVADAPASGTTSAAHQDVNAKAEAARAATERKEAAAGSSSAFDRSTLAEAHCPYDNALYHRETLATDDRIGKPRTGKGAVVVLGQKRLHLKYGRDSLKNLRKMLDNFYKVYNAAQRDDVIVFHDGDLDNQTQAEVKAGRGEVSFYLLSGQHWEIFPSDLRNADQSLWLKPGPIGYRLMIRFYTVHIWPILDSLGYRWVMRLDDDSTMAGQISYNLFGFMETYKLSYAYRNLAYESGFSGCKWHEWVTNFVQDRNNNQYGWLLDTCANKSASVPFTPPNCGQFRAFYNNFFVADVRRFMQPDVQRLLHAIDQSGVMFTHRWNDLIIQSLAVQLFLPKEEVHHFTGWGYGHHSGPSSEMGYGIAQAGRMAGTWPEQRLQLKHMLLMDWGWKPWYVNRMLEPGPSADLHGLYTVHSKPGFGLIKQSTKQLEQSMGLQKCNRRTMFNGWLC